MKLFIFEPCAKWDYCGGVVMALAHNLDEAKHKVHRQFAKERLVSNAYNFENIVNNRMTLEEIINVIKTTDNQKLKERFSKENLSIDTMDIDRIGKENANSCGQYWELFQEIDTNTRLFSNGEDIYINYNYA